MKYRYMTLLIMVSSVTLHGCNTVPTSSMSSQDVLKIGSECKQAGLEFKVHTSHTLPATMMLMNKNQKTAYLSSVRGSRKVYDAWCAAPDEYNYKSGHTSWKSAQNLSQSELVAKVKACRFEAPVAMRRDLENYAVIKIHPFTSEITDVACKGTKIS